MPFLQPLLVLGDVVLGELLVREERGEEVLSLGRDEPKARHLGCRSDDRVVVRVNSSDPKAWEAENLHDACVVWRAKNGARVNLVADKMDLLLNNEIHEEVELGLGHCCAERVRRVGDEDTFDFEVTILGFLISSFESTSSDFEAIGACTVYWHNLCFCSPF
ncbi:hypothetical protein EUGRSUZ_H02339 [Eucalyptus grandis]|uniref:Uncharacterized protein n=2 Tax=Eucalyptus grandis TaxID=71139 RepID=A0ACC3JR69_EUCGR|nr:hypothetical protein EUGRSUZ_H02339 [Eucalyptus grandis]